ncbi:hypothetical protein [Paenibacillus tengchongensis]|uniref:hypothetical protein n=1 Tax=Paenibacillus tengchongensis TaxID=2608684 RepID=UPI00124EEBEC|nr:hypothetical protein [Paenibacillus tengchongensis]
MADKNIMARRKFLHMALKANYKVRVHLSEHLLNTPRTNHLIPINISDLGLSTFGECFATMTHIVTIESYTLSNADIRPPYYQIKTVFHEFYHARMHNLVYDGHSNYNRWLAMEETAAETAAHAMYRLIGLKQELNPAYGHYLVQLLPRLKRLEKSEFKNCLHIHQFGLKFLKYRFSENTASWMSLMESCVKIKLDIIDYAFVNYRDYVYANTQEIASIIWESENDPDKFADKNAYIQYIADDIIYGWENKEITYPGMYNSLCIAMNRIGVK